MYNPGQAGMERDGREGRVGGREKCNRKAERKKKKKKARGGQRFKHRDSRMQRGDRNVMQEIAVTSVINTVEAGVSAFPKISRK